MLVLMHCCCRVVFYYLSYEGSVDLERITDPVEKCSLEAQIQEFGQTPTLLFASPHPARHELGKHVDIATHELLPSPRDGQVAPPSTNGTSVQPQHGDDQLSNGEKSDGSFNEDEDGDNADNRRGMFGFRGRSLGVPKQAQWIVGGLTAQIRRRMSVESPRRWGWSFTGKKPGGDNSYWAGSSPHLLHSGYVSSCLCSLCSCGLLFCSVWWQCREVTSLLLSRDGRALFSTSKDTTFKVSASLDGTLRRNLSCNLALSCCDVSPDEKYVFIGSWDNCMYMYSVEFGRVVDQVTAHDDGLSAVCVSDDRVVTSSWDGSVKMWHYTQSGITTPPLLTFMECEESVVSLSVSSDGTIAAAGTRAGAHTLLLCMG